MASALRVSLLEPFYGGSHKRWADAYVQHSAHNVTLHRLSAAHWKWRMHGAAISMVNAVVEAQADVILCSSLLDVAALRGLLPRAFSGVPVVTYFHENQLAYPFQGNDPKDRHYGWINYTTALASDLNVFNSQYNRDSFIEKLTPFLKVFPDHQNLDTVAVIKEKAEVVYPGLACDDFVESAGRKSNRLLWNHRWEHDKGPEVFLELLNQLDVAGCEFELVLLGEQYAKTPDAMSQILIQHADKIVHQGWIEDRTAYRSLVASCGILPVTSRHEFYGYSVLEAILSGCTPILPSELVYPEYADALAERCYYSTTDNLITKVIEQVSSPNPIAVPSAFRQQHAIETTSKQLDRLLENTLC